MSCVVCRERKERMTRDNDGGGKTEGDFEVITSNLTELMPPKN